MEVESLIKIPWAIETDGALRVKPLLEIRRAAALTTGAKHWHR